MGKKSAVSTPLILLQQLSRSLLQHFEKACDQALNETQRVLAKLQKQRDKIEQRLRKAEVALEAAAVAGKAKARARAREAIEALQHTLDEVLDRQVQTHAYLLQLQRDVETSLGLAQGIGKVGDAAGQALDAVTGAARRSAPAATPAKRPAKPRATAVKAATDATAEALPKPRARRPVSAVAKQPATRRTSKPTAP